jgi:hypothetical protein
MDRTGTKAVIIAGALALVAVVGFIDSRFPDLTFALFYLIPVFLTSWYIGRAVGAGIATASAVFGLVADIVSDNASIGYAYVNGAFRLVLLLIVGSIVVRLHVAIARERLTATTRGELMRRVAAGAQEPLGDINARVVDLGFELSASAPDRRQLIGEIVQASGRLARLVQQLEEEEPVRRVGNDS